jgi:alkylation response protein AidB-like acyl-CoA dehydrogenase
MRFAFTEEQEELRATARAFLADRSGSDDVRRAMESAVGWDADLWKQMAGELGWTAVHIPEAYGGIGLGYVELVGLLEVMGEALVCAPFFSTVCLGANAILCGGSETQKQELLPGIAEGQTRATLATGDVRVEAQREGGDWILSGDTRHVVDGHTADRVIVPVRTDAGISLFAVSGDSAGLERHALPTLDRTRRLANLTFANARVPDTARLDGDTPGEAALAQALDLARVALAAEQVGGAQRCLDLSVQYAKEREQFGRPIGSFQAVKHTCADMMVRVEAARSAAYWAACAAAQQEADLPVLASLAKATASEAYFACAGDAIQVHGGVGFTWEYDVHLYFKRARASEAFLGDPAWHRERVAQHMGL